jgi:hypothetical protein
MGNDKIKKLMNDKFQIITALTFSENNLESAYKMLYQEVSDSVSPSNGELREMTEKINDIISEAKKFKELLGGVKEIDGQRRELIENVSEKKNEE